MALKLLACILLCGSAWATPLPMEATNKLDWPTVQETRLEAKIALALVWANGAMNLYNWDCKNVRYWLALDNWECAYANIRRASVDLTRYVRYMDTARKLQDRLDKLIAKRKARHRRYSDCKKKLRDTL